MKIILIITILLLNLTLKAQSYTTGTITLSNTQNLEMTACITLNNKVELTLTGPAQRWFAIGFNATYMQEGTDVVFSNSATNLDSFDRHIIGLESPKIDSTQNWKIISNEVVNNKRIIKATRELNTNDPNDFIFTPTIKTLNLIWSRANFNDYFPCCHFSNRGTVEVKFNTLSTENHILKNFKLYPNPASQAITMELNEEIYNATLHFIDTQGRIISSYPCTQKINTIPTNHLKKGIYIAKIEAEKEIYTQKILLE